MGVVTYCDSTISTYVRNFSPFLIKILSVDGGKDFIGTNEKHNTIGTKTITSIGVVIDPRHSSDAVFKFPS